MWAVLVLWPCAISVKTSPDPSSAGCSWRLFAKGAGEVRCPRQACCSNGVSQWRVCRGWGSTLHLRLPVFTVPPHDTHVLAVLRMRLPKCKGRYVATECLSWIKTRFCGLGRFLLLLCVVSTLQEVSREDWGLSFRREEFELWKFAQNEAWRITTSYHISPAFF